MDIDGWTNGPWAEDSCPVDDLTPKFALGFWATSIGALGPSDSFAVIRDILTERASTPSSGAYYRCDLDDIAGMEDKLLSYLRTLSAPVDPGTLRIGPQLDLSLELRSQATGVVIGFPWWDSLHDMEPFLRWLRGHPSINERPEEPFSDLDQGWIFSAVKRGGRVHFRDGDFDTLTETANVSVALTAFSKRLDDAESAARVITSAIERELLAIL